VLGGWLARAIWLVLARDRAGLGDRGQSGWLALAESWCWLAALQLAEVFPSGTADRVFLGKPYRAQKQVGQEKCNKNI
jgi:hypothetical protein